MLPASPIGAHLGRRGDRRPQRRRGRARTLSPPDRGRGGARRVPAAAGAAPRCRGVPPRAGPPLLRRPGLDPRRRDTGLSVPSTPERRWRPGFGARRRPGTLAGWGGL